MAHRMLSHSSRRYVGKIAGFPAADDCKAQQFVNDVKELFEDGIGKNNEVKMRNVPPARVLCCGECTPLPECSVAMALVFSSADVRAPLMTSSCTRTVNCLKSTLKAMAQNCLGSRSL